MKKLFLLILIQSILIAFSSAQCSEPAFVEFNKVVAKKDFRVLPNQAETSNSLSFSGTIENASWGKKESESGVVSVFVDGIYNQDIILFAGSARFTYHVVLGKFSPGVHKVAIVLNEKRSAENIEKIKNPSVAVDQISPKSKEEKMAISYSPMLYLRPDTIDKFSDIPLITYYEILPIDSETYRIRYSTIFTNEDGGTQTTALMARWGRATDIEWVYEIRVKNGAVDQEILQGANHITKPFAGRRFSGMQPIIFDVTVNNNFNDSGCSQLRTSLLPIKADLSKKSRETIMDENPWTYRIMAEEAMREGRVNPNNLGVNVIDDLRRYFYVETYSENENSTITVELIDKNGKKSRSDFGDLRLRIDRNGFQRIAVRMPAEVGEIVSINLLCEPSLKKDISGMCKNMRIPKFVYLAEDFSLKEVINSNSIAKTVSIGERISWDLSKKSAMK